jgi:hypothetical protein
MAESSHSTLSPRKNVPYPKSRWYVVHFLKKSLRVLSDGGPWGEGAELLVYLVDEEKDIYIGVLVLVCHLASRAQPS